MSISYPSLAWDTFTLVVVCVSLFYTMKLRGIFKGGGVGKSYSYYLAANVVLLAAFVIRIGFDIEGINSVQAYGVSPKDVAIVIVLVLFALGMRFSVRFWDPSRLASRGMEGGKPSAVP